MNCRTTKTIMGVAAVVAISSIASWSFAMVSGAKPKLSGTKTFPAQTARRFKSERQAHLRKWRSTIQDLQKQAAKKQGEYKEDIEILKEQSYSKIDEYKQDIKEIKDKTIKILRSPETQKHLMGDEFVDQDENEKEIYIFISSSMHKNNLIDLSRQAKAQDAVLVMRGFIDNSYLKTINYFQKIIEKSGQGIVIDPELFKTYQIQEVPSFVMASGNKYDKLSGNVTLKYAISEMKSKGEVFQTKDEK